MGKSVERGKIEKWLRRQIYGRKLERCEKIELRHLAIGKHKGEEVQSYAIEARVEERELVELAEQIDSHAQEDANGMGALQRYVLLAYFKEDESSHGRFVFRKSAEKDDEDGDSFDSEPPTKQGLVAQQMRHNEIIMRNSNFTMGQMLSMLKEQNRELQDENRTLRQERREQIETYEKLLSLQHERELETKRHEFMLKAKEQMFEKIALLAPAIVNRMMGKKVLPEKTTPESMALKALMDTITPEQMQKMNEVFTPDQLISILNLYESNRGKDPNGVKLIEGKKEN